MPVGALKFWGVISAAKRVSGQAEMQASILGHVYLSLGTPAVCFGVELEGRRSQQSPTPSLCGFNSQRGLEMQNSYWVQQGLLHPSAHISVDEALHVFSQLSQAFILP